MDDTLTRDRATWQGLFDQLGRGRHGQPVTIEVLDEDFGDQTEAVRLPFDSASFDDKGDVVVIALGGRKPHWPVVLRHFIHHPQQIDLLEQPGSVLVVRVVDQEGVQTLITFRPDET